MVRDVDWMNTKQEQSDGGFDAYLGIVDYFSFVFFSSSFCFRPLLQGCISNLPVPAGTVRGLLQDMGIRAFHEQLSVAISACPDI